MFSLEDRVYNSPNMRHTDSAYHQDCKTKQQEQNRQHAKFKFLNSCLKLYRFVHLFISSAMSAEELCALISFLAL